MTVKAGEEGCDKATKSKSSHQHAFLDTSEKIQRRVRNKINEMKKKSHEGVSANTSTNF